jgi:oligopeptide transport system ATP-binding protein
MSDQTETQPILEVIDLVKYFPLKTSLFSKSGAFVRAVDGVSLTLEPRETLGLVGESGCGKSTVGRSILRLLEPTSGRVIFSGEDVTRLDKKRLKELRKEMQIIFQDPYSSLDPRMGIEDILGEAFEVHDLAKGSERRQRIKELLEMVGLSSSFLRSLPHEFSGGQRQRICIARALAVEPKLVICDEPVSALDVSVQAQVINLLQDLQEKYHLAYIFISHDLSVVEHICDRIAVMYLGKIVELAPKRTLFRHALHPYTKALLSASPSMGGQKGERIILRGEIPSPIDPPAGCYFHPRCFLAKPACSQVTPELKEKENGHFVSCLLYS